MIVVGFLVGVLISSCMFYLMLVEFEVDLLPAVISALVLSTVLPFGLAFSPRIRCVTMLIMPSMFTGRVCENRLAKHS